MHPFYLPQGVLWPMQLSGARLRNVYICVRFHDGAGTKYHTNLRFHIISKIDPTMTELPLLCSGLFREPRKQHNRTREKLRNYDTTTVIMIRTEK